MRNGAGLLITITNDAWYGQTAGPYQHFILAAMRAVENRRALARAANTGISGFVDPVGRVLDATPLEVEAAIVRPLPLMGVESIYPATATCSAGPASASRYLRSHAVAGAGAPRPPPAGVAVELFALSV